MTAEEHLREAEYWLNAIKGLHARRLRKYRAECIAKAAGPRHGRSGRGDYGA